jgi:hypothetical protein
MSETDSRETHTEPLSGSDRTALVALVALLGGLAVGWAGRSVVAGEPVSAQFWLLPVALGLLTAHYALAVEP